MKLLMSFLHCSGRYLTMSDGSMTSLIIEDSLVVILKEDLLCSNVTVSPQFVSKSLE